MSSTDSHVPPFHRLLSFYSNRNPHDSQTIRFQDSIKGNLALGLDFPVACAVALGRHLFLRNVSSFSLSIYVPKVSWRTTPLEDLAIDEKKDYTCSELVSEARKQGLGIMGMMECAGLWGLGADVRTGLLKGEDVGSFQRGRVFGEVEGRRKFRGDGDGGGKGEVLPFWRGGPVWVGGHSWVVGRVFGVEVYLDGDGGGEKED
ncbi:hypothetical protein BST61_g2637 [Cercospora zeina]